MSRLILTLNAGSSSLKFALFKSGADDLKLIGRGAVSGIGTEPEMRVHDVGGAIMDRRVNEAADRHTHEDFLEAVFEWVDEHVDQGGLAAVGHRIVHGGCDFDEPVELSQAVQQRLEALSPLAPLHQPHNLAAVRAACAARPSVMQIGCFDTAFHRTQRELATRFGLPRAWHEAGVRRYGFHGLSYEFICERLRALDPALAAGRVVIAHLGNGASLCGVRNGASVDTTMGFTALDGLLMGTRCGSLDPGVILHLQEQHGLDVQAVRTLLYNQSGLLGVSGVSSDMRTLLARTDELAVRQALDLYVFRIVRELGALAGSLGGLDGIVFTAGIGENASAIRAAVLEELTWLGIRINPVANEAGAGCITTPESRMRAWVIPTDEESMIARHTARMVEGGSVA